MEERELCVTKYRLLLQLLDEEERDLSRILQGEVLEAYLRILEQERSSLKDTLNTIKNI